MAALLIDDKLIIHKIATLSGLKLNYWCYSSMIYASICLLGHSIIILRVELIYQWCGLNNYEKHVDLINSFYPFRPMFILNQIEIFFEEKGYNAISGKGRINLVQAFQNNLLFGNSNIFVQWPYYST